MGNARIESLRKLLEKDDTDGMTRYMLANELYKEGEFEEAAQHLDRYLREREDEGAAYRILAECYVELGKTKDAQWALRQGAEAARNHHHDGMANELDQRLREIS